MTTLTGLAAALPAYQPTSRSDALAAAEQIGVDGIYGPGDDWHQALRDTCARWAAEGALARLQNCLGITPALITATNPHEQPPTPTPPTYPVPSPTINPDEEAQPS